MSTQMPTGVRNSVCDALGMAQEQVRVVVGDTSMDEVFVSGLLGSTSISDVPMSSGKLKVALFLSPVCVVPAHNVPTNMVTRA